MMKFVIKGFLTGDILCEDGDSLWFDNVISKEQFKYFDCFTSAELFLNSNHQSMVFRKQKAFEINKIYTV